MKKRFWPDNYVPPPWLPDWRYEEEYSHLAINTEYSFDNETGSLTEEAVMTSKREYGWEFLRRNPTYQMDYCNLVELAKQENVLDRYQKSLGLNIFDMNHQPPKSIKFHAELYRTLKKRGLGYYLLDPSLDVHDTATLTAISRLGINCYSARHVENALVASDAIDSPEANRTEPVPIDGGIIPGDNENYWLFDISLPIEPQLLRAKSYLEMAQVLKFTKKISASKTETKKFSIYLRILDADANKADDKDIMAVLFPGEDRFSYDDKNDKPYKNETTHRNPGRDMLKNHRKAAYYLRDEGYKLLF